MVNNLRKTAQKIKGLLEKKPLMLIDEAYQLALLKHAPDMADVIWEVKRAFEKKIAPVPTTTGCQTSFFLKDCDENPIAIFKLENIYREVAAYRLDYHHFAGVPQTVITTLEHPLWGRASGSCQWYVPQSIAAVEIQTELFQHFSEDRVRRIASLDVRTMNTDRHTSNLLLTGQNELIPIDHGFILPQKLEKLHFVWFDWKQAATAFNEPELSYISLLDPEHDRHLLIKELCIEPERANRLFIATLFLKLGAIKQLTAYQIGILMAEQLESLVDHLKRKGASDWTSFSPYIYDEIEKRIDTYAKTAHQHPDPTTHR